MSGTTAKFQTWTRRETQSFNIFFFQFIVYWLILSCGFVFFYISPVMDNTNDHHVFILGISFASSLCNLVCVCVDAWNDSLSLCFCYAMSCCHQFCQVSHSRVKHQAGGSYHHLISVDKGKCNSNMTQQFIFSCIRSYWNCLLNIKSQELPLFHLAFEYDFCVAFPIACRMKKWKKKMRFSAALPDLF